MNDQPSRKKTIDHKWLVMFALSIGTFMATLDASIVNVSLPHIMADLNTDLVTVQWLVTIYLLVVTSLLLTLGRCSDLFGRKRIYIAGYTVFAVGALLCGLAPSVHLLILARGFQAIGAAMIMATSPAILTSAFPGSERGRAMGVMGTIVALGLTAGPALGGFIIAAWGWPWIFYINLPVGIIGIAIAQLVLPGDTPRSETRFDIPGAVLLSIGLASATLGLNQGAVRGWTAGFILALFAISLTAGALFILRERVEENPILDLSLFKNRIFAAASASAYIAFSATFTIAFLMPFYLTEILGYEPRRMGLTLTTIPITLAIIAPFSGSLSDRIGSRIPASIGLGIAAFGLLLVSRLGMEPTAFHVIGALLVIGIGTGMFHSPNNSAIMGSVPREMLGVAAGMMATMRNLGMVTGVVVSGAIFAGRRMAYTGRFEGLEASALAFHDVFVVAAAICLIGVVTSAVRGGRSVKEPELETI